MSSKQGRHWCLTLWTEEAPDFTGCVAYAYQRERCPTTQRLHWQCYTCWPKPVRFSTLVKRYPKGDIGHKWGTNAQAWAYCTKAATRIEGTEPTTFGECPPEQHVQGNKEIKRKWEDAYEAACTQDIESIPKDMLIKYYGTFQKIANDHVAVPTTLDYESTPNLWFYGPTGTGKSKKARTEHPGAYIKSTTNEWWDKYKNEEVAIIEDISPFEVKLGTNLKIWSDRYPFPANQKFGGATIRPGKVIVTSNYAIRDIWKDEETAGPLERRFKQIEFVL